MLYIVYCFSKFYIFFTVILILQHGCNNPSIVQAKGVMPGKFMFLLPRFYYDAMYTYINFMYKLLNFN